MKKFISTFLFLFLIFIVKFSFYNSEYFEDYYRGEKIEKESSSETDTNNNQVDCICDTDPDSCDYLCCCDNNCPNEAIEDWRKHLKCIDEKDTVGIFADRCIDKNLVVQSNKRRGLKIEEQTEDISKYERTIINLCYSMDNSGKMKKKITTLNDLGKDKYKEYNEFNKIEDVIYQQYINEKILKNLNEKSGQNSGSNVKTENDKNYISINYINKDNKDSNDIKFKFIRNNKFSLFSGTSCYNLNNVELMKAENYSCYMSEIIDENSFKNIKIGDANCNTFNKYKLEKENGYLIIEKDKEDYECIKGNYRIREVEFVLKLNEANFTKIEGCIINFVCEEKKDSGYIFKNSVIFSHNNEVPYRYSGQGGYLNNSPLKIYNGQKIYNEFYIVGRDKNGNCREAQNIYDYLYDFDVPFSFNRDYVYSCDLGNMAPQDTALYNKILEINKIAKYGSSSFNINNETEWLKVNQFSVDNDVENYNFYINMTVYIGTKKVGLYSHKYIYDITIKTNKVKSNKRTLQFRIKYYDLDGDNSSENIYSKKPDYPAFLPRIPGDILDPMIYSNVDK